MNPPSRRSQLLPTHPDAAPAFAPGCPRAILARCAAGGLRQSARQCADHDALVVVRPGGHQSRIAARARADESRRHRRRRGGHPAIRWRSTTPRPASTTCRYLSDEYIDDLRFAAQEAARLGLRMDMTLGSGWPFGGPAIPVTQAAGELRVERVPVAPGRQSVVAPATECGEKLLAAFLAPRPGREPRPPRCEAVRPQYAMAVSIPARPSSSPAPRSSSSPAAPA